jgi:Uma2 family endonuclease
LLKLREINFAPDDCCYQITNSRSIFGAEKHYELVSGNLIEMPPESTQNAEIAIKLLLIFAQFISPRLLRCKNTEIVVSGTRATVCLPNLMVLTENLADDLYSSQRSTINIDMFPPALVVEIVSPGKAKGKANRDRDYRFKRCSPSDRSLFLIHFKYK